MKLSVLKFWGEGQKQFWGMRFGLRAFKKNCLPLSIMRINMRKKNGLVGYSVVNWEEWTTRLRCWDGLGRFLVQTPTWCSTKLRDPTLLWGSSWPSGQIFMITQWLAAGEWRCPLNNGLKMTKEQPNSR